MSIIREISIKCMFEGHNENLQLACFNLQCKENRVYCYTCNRNSDHVAHQQDQYGLKELISFIENIRIQSHNLAKEIEQQMENINLKFSQLIFGLKKKYQLQKERLSKLNSKQLNQAFNEMIQFKEKRNNIYQVIQNISNELIIQLENQILQLKLEDLNYHQPIPEDQIKAEELSQIGYQLYFNQDKYQEAIQYFDTALFFNSNHIKSLYLKAECLGLLGNYNEALKFAERALQVDSTNIDCLQTKGRSNYKLQLAECLKMLGKCKEAIQWANKALEIDENHVSSLQTLAVQKYLVIMVWAQKALDIDQKNVFLLQIKAGCLRSLKNYKEAIQWSNKALEIDSKHINSLFTKGDSLRMLGNQDDAIKTLDEVLKLNPQHGQSLASKGACLQQLKRYKEAIQYFNMALQINPNDSWSLSNKTNCEKFISNIN